MQWKHSQAIESTVEGPRDDLLRWLTTEIGPVPSGSTSQQHPPGPLTQSTQLLELRSP